MRNLFSYENKIMQMLMLVGDMIILNLLFLLCCLPLPLGAVYLSQTLGLQWGDLLFWGLLVLSLFPMGAAQAGLYTAVKVMMDKEDDSSLVSAYFRGFRSGFGRISLANTLLLLLIAVTLVAIINSFLLQASGLSEGGGLPLVVSCLALFIIISYQGVLPLFHSRFDCSVLQLFRNCAYVTLLHPIRSLGAACLTWFPLLLALLNLNIFVAVTPLFIALAFAVAHTFAYTIMRKPLEQMIAGYYEKNGLEDPNKPAPEPQEEE